MNIPQNNIEVNSQEGNPDETAAVLSFATKLSEQMMPKAPQTQEMGGTSDLNQKDEERGVEEQKAPEIDLKANNKEMEKVIDSKLNEFKKEIKTTIKEQISEIKDSIQEALQEDGE